MESEVRGCDQNLPNTRCTSFGNHELDGYMVKVTVRDILPWQDFTMGGKCLHSLRYLLKLYSSVSCGSIASAVALRTDNDGVLKGSLHSVKIRNTWQVSTARGHWSAEWVSLVGIDLQYYERCRS